MLAGAILMFHLLGAAVSALATWDFIKANDASSSVLGVFVIAGFTLSAAYVGGAL